MNVFECEQYSEEWAALRCGLPTASQFDRIITLRHDLSKQRENYLYQLAGERITGKSEEVYQSPAMLRGLELEPEARKFYELVCDQEVRKVGFCLSDCGRYGASPDGFVGEDGLIQIKCPALATHIGYIDKRIFVNDYFQQVQGELLVTGRKWVDFLSYYPGLPPLIVRVERDEEFLMALKVELENFCRELDEVTARLKERNDTL